MHLMITYYLIKILKQKSLNISLENAMRKIMMLFKDIKIIRYMNYLLQKKK